MRLGILGIIISIFVFFLSQPLFSQAETEKPKAAEAEKTEPEEKDPSKLWVDLSGVMYFEWAYFTGFNGGDGSPWSKVAKWGIDDSNYPALSGVRPTNYSSSNNNTIRLQRAYITLRKDIGDLFSVKLTTDINPTTSDFIFLKYGFVQFLKEFFTPYGVIYVKLQAGKIATPVTGMTDWLSDLRWIGKNYLDQSNTVLNGKSFDNASDFGGLFSMGLFQFIRLEYTYTNGEGYRFDNSEAYAGKAHTVMVSVNPEFFRIKELFVNFYGRWEDVNKNRIDETPSLPSVSDPIKYGGIDGRQYYGVGAAWRSDLIKFGLNFFMPKMRFARTAFIFPITAYAPNHTEKFYLIDSWLNFNLGAVVRTVPILIIGKCAYGTEMKSLIGNQRQQRTTIVAGAGLGWQFNQYFRLAAYYEYINRHLAAYITYFSKKDPTPNNNVYLKFEVKY